MIHNMDRMSGSEKLKAKTTLLHFGPIGHTLSIFKDNLRGNPDEQAVDIVSNDIFMYGFDWLSSTIPESEILQSNVAGFIVDGDPKTPTTEKCAPTIHS